MTNEPESRSGTLHVVTVGTSVIGNFKREKGGGPELPSKQELVDFLNTDTRQRSAELNSLLPALKTGDRVHLLGTGSPDGKLACEAIGRWLKQHGVAHDQGVQEELIGEDMGGARDPHDFYRAACAFRDALFGVARRAMDRHEPVVIHATGGLKPQVALAAQVASEVGLKCRYIHEQMENAVELPTTVADELLTVLAAVNAVDDPRKRAGAVGGRLEELERQCLVVVQRGAEGEVSAVKISEFGRHLIDKRGK